MYFILGAIAKTVSTVITYPLQVIQSRLRVSTVCFCVFVMGLTVMSVSFVMLVIFIVIFVISISSVMILSFVMVGLIISTAADDVIFF